MRVLLPRLHVSATRSERKAEHSPALRAAAELRGASYANWFGKKVHSNRKVGAALCE